MAAERRRFPEIDLATERFIEDLSTSAAPLVARGQADAHLGHPAGVSRSAPSNRGVIDTAGSGHKSAVPTVLRRLTTIRCRSVLAVHEVLPRSG